MAEVIAESGLSAGAIYGYHASKDDLILDLAQTVLGSRMVMERYLTACYHHGGADVDQAAAMAGKATPAMLALAQGYIMQRSIVLLTDFKPYGEAIEQLVGNAPRWMPHSSPSRTSAIALCCRRVRSLGNNRSRSDQGEMVLR